MKKFGFNRIESEKLKEIRELRNKRSLIQSIKKAKKNGLNPVIAEIKRKSPSKGKIRDIDIVKAAIQLEKGGACAISVLTDKHFGGRIDDLKAVKNSVKIPVLRKDFIVDEFQIYESYANGADAILLISSLLKEKTENFVRISNNLGLECLIEIHDEEDLEFALDSGSGLIGINNRDLKTLEIDLGTTEKLMHEIPEDRIVVSESGINDKNDLRYVLTTGADAVLIGTSIMLAGDIERKIKEFTKLIRFSNPRNSKGNFWAHRPKVDREENRSSQTL